MAGDVKIKWFGKKVSELATQVGLDAMNRAAFLLEADIKKSMARTRRDFSVRRRRGVHFHHPSLVGSPPAPDTGILMSSINHEIEVDASGISGFVGVEAGVKHGLFLELGTINMMPRPFLRPALARNKKQIDAIFQKAYGG